MLYSQEQVAEETRRFFHKVFFWMFLGLTLSSLVAIVVATNEILANAIINSPLMIFIFIFQLILVFGLVAVIERISANTAIFLFLLYSFLTGLTLSVIFFIFTLSSIGITLAITAGMFGIMSIYGFVTDADLTSMGKIMYMGLIGIIIAGIANWFLQNPMIDYITAFIGVIIFTGLTAYDVQKIKHSNVIGNEGTEDDQKEAIIGALRLYLDFINLFLSLLRLTGNRK